MNIAILNHKTLKEIPSASGIELLGDTLFIIGDDSPWLFKLNHKYEITEKIPLSEIPNTVGGKISKAEKSDFEAMASYDNKLFLFGSGSKSPKRDALLAIKPNSPPEIKKYQLTSFYDELCSLSKLRRQDLNLEAAVIINDDLFLFNRGNNCIFKLNILQLLDYLELKKTMPAVNLFLCNLPSIKGIQSGFSGATASPDGQDIIFTASAENTSNWIDDGEIMGSFLGVFSIQSLIPEFTPSCEPITDTQNKILKIKVESVVVLQQYKPKKLSVLLVTDNDLSCSEIINAELDWN